MKKKLTKTLALTAAVIIFVGLVIEFRARREFGQGEDALRSGKVDEAVKHFARSLNWYIPFGTAENAAESLTDLGLGLVLEGKNREAANALALARGGLYAARSFYTPRKDIIARVEPVLAKLRARERLGDGAEVEKLARQAMVYLEKMQAPDRPELAPSLAAVLGFFLWFGAVLGLIFRGFGQEGLLSINRSWVWAVLWAAGFSIWIWGMKWS